MTVTRSGASEDAAAATLASHWLETPSDETGMGGGTDCSFVRVPSAERVRASGSISNGT
ncbi:MAG TPA: hypothetical protein VGF94_17930 [Kofleriaceae bacterium]